MLRLRRPPAFIFVLCGLLAMAGLGIAAFVLVSPTGRTGADVTTGASRDHPDLVPHRYDMPVDNTTVFAAEAARRLPGWRVADTDRANGIVRAQVRRIFPLPGTDDVVITVVPEGNGSRVTIRSHSRGGSADPGANARHIRDLQAAMDARLPEMP